MFQYQKGAIKTRVLEAGGATRGLPFNTKKVRLKLHDRMRARDKRSTFNTKKVRLKR